jgi:predicted nucleic acid-binding protein
LARNREGWVIDASVASKWYLRDEDHQAEAQSFWDRFERNGILAVAPMISKYEVANAVSVATWLGRIDPSSALAGVRHYADSGILIDPDPDWLVDEATRISCRFRISAYDASYLALAQALRMNFVTADERLRNKVAGQMTFVHWVGDIQPQ